MARACALVFRVSDDELCMDTNGEDESTVSCIGDERLQDEDIEQE